MTPTSKPHESQFHIKEPEGATPVLPNKCQQGR